jgi:hypothetical protein
MSTFVYKQRGTANSLAGYWLNDRVQVQRKRNAVFLSSTGRIQHLIFRKEIRTLTDRDELREKLARNHLSYVWLINQLRRKNVVTDKTEMSSVVAGTRNGKKAETILSVSLDILDSYEKEFLTDAEHV